MQNEKSFVIIDNQHREKQLFWDAVKKGAEISPPRSILSGDDVSFIRFPITVKPYIIDQLCIEEGFIEPTLEKRGKNLFIRCRKCATSCRRERERARSAAFFWTAVYCFYKQGHVFLARGHTIDSPFQDSLQFIALEGLTFGFRVVENNLKTLVEFFVPEGQEVSQKAVKSFLRLQEGIPYILYQDIKFLKKHLVWIKETFSLPWWTKTDSCGRKLASECVSFIYRRGQKNSRECECFSRLIGQISREKDCHHLKETKLLLSDPSLLLKNVKEGTNEIGGKVIWSKEKACFLLKVGTSECGNRGTITLQRSSFMFHTHPLSVCRDLDHLIATPSAGDISESIDVETPIFVQFICATEGIYVLQYTPEFWYFYFYGMKHNKKAIEVWLKLWLRYLQNEEFRERNYVQRSILSDFGFDYIFSEAGLSFAAMLKNSAAQNSLFHIISRFIETINDTSISDVLSLSHESAEEKTARHFVRRFVACSIRPVFIQLVSYPKEEHNRVLSFQVFPAYLE